MLCNKSILFFLSVLLFYTANAESCAVSELGPAQDFVTSVDKLLYVSWRPPTGFESCEVDYNLHVQNMNTSDYLAPVQNLTGHSFVLDYAKNDNICIHLKATLYSNYNDQRSAAYAFNFLDPLIEVGAPSSFTVVNSDKALSLTWTVQEGYEKCYAFFMYSVSIKSKNTGEYIFAWNISGYSFLFTYPEWHPHFCEEVDIEIVAHYRGGRGGSLSQSGVFGPAGLCQ